MVTNHEAGWRVEDNDADRERFTAAPKGQTESITFRAYTHHLRVLDEIIQSGVDPRLKTKSDCLQDALALLIENWVDYFQDGLSGTTLRRQRMEITRRRRAAREQFLAEWDDELDVAKSKQDQKELENLLMDICYERGDREKDSPDSHVYELDRRISALKTMLGRVE